MKKIFITIIAIGFIFAISSCASNKAHCDAYGKAETIQEPIDVEMV